MFICYLGYKYFPGKNFLFLHTEEMARDTVGTLKQVS